MGNDECAIFLDATNLCINDTTNNNSYMNVWHEVILGRGGNEISSCLFNVLKTKINTRRVIVWADNCASQNKNKMILFVMLYLVAKQVFDEIIIKYFVSGHSFMPCDRDFGLIEKRKRLSKAMVPDDLYKIIAESRPSKPFKVLHMNPENFFDFGKLADNFINTTNLNITKASQIKVSSDDPTVVKIKRNFSTLCDWENFSVYKKSKSPAQLPQLQKLPNIQKTHELSTEKKKDLLNVIPYLQKEEDRQFYRDLCCSVNNEGRLSDND